MEYLGAGEILLQSIDNDGKGSYDIELIKSVASNVNIPVIACGGVGSFEHYADGIEAGATAVYNQYMAFLKKWPIATLKSLSG